MGLQKYRSDSNEPQNDDAVLHYADWIGGADSLKNHELQN